MCEIPILENEEMWASKVIDEQQQLYSKLNKPQEMWVDVITAILTQESFDVKVGDMGYVFRNMIAKFSSSADYYRVSAGVYDTIIHPNKELLAMVESEDPLDMKKYFYGRDKPSLLEHIVPAAVIAKALLSLGVAPSKSKVQNILSRCGGIAIILRTENALLSRSTMPNGWDLSQSSNARYTVAGIELRCGVFIRRNGAIYR